MAIASGSRIQLAFILETVINTTPASPTMKLLRATTRNINLTKNILESAEVRADRQRADVRHGLNKVEGTAGFELGIRSFDDILQCAMSSAWTAITISAVTTLTMGTPGTLTRASGSWVADGLRVGDVIKTTGFTNGVNNSNFTITAVTATVLTIDPGASTLIVEAASATPVVTYPGKRLDIGKTLYTLAMERQFIDISQYQLFNGVAVNSLKLSIKPEAIVMGEVGFLGMSAAPFSGTTASTGGVPSVPATNSPFSSFDGSIYEAATPYGLITGLEVTLANGRALAGVVGSKFSPTVFEGMAKVNGTVMSFFQNAVLFNKFVNETESSIATRLNDLNGTDFIQLVLPRVKYTGATIDPPPEAGIVENLPFEGLVDSVSGTSMWLQRSNAV